MHRLKKSRLWQTISSQFRSECKPILYLQYLFYNVCILCLSRSVKKPKTTARLSEKSGNKLCFYWFQLCLLSRPCTYCYRFLHEPVLDIKASWLNNTEAYLVPLLVLSITQLQDSKNRGLLDWVCVAHLTFCFEETLYRTFHRWCLANFNSCWQMVLEKSF